MRNDCQCSIDITWRMHRPPRAMVSVSVTPHEVIAVIRRMRVGAAPSRGAVHIRVFWKCILTIFALACNGVQRFCCIVATSHQNGAHLESLPLTSQAKPIIHPPGAIAQSAFCLQRGNFRKYTS